VTHLLRIAALLLVTASPAEAEKPAKIPVTLGNWKGPHANTFKGAVRRGVSKGCVVVKKDKARVVIDGEVTESSPNHFTVRVMVKSPKNDEIIESREYAYSKPNASGGQADRMGRDIVAIAQRAPQ
jgi:hypothetical protein